MPYVTQATRDRMRDEGGSGHHPQMYSPGELNYEITVKIIRYVKQHGLSYQTINDVIGALEGAKVEFYRRVAAPYEDQKIKDNGDVY